MQEPRRNIELKCRCADLAEVRQRARQLGATDAGVLQQHDTFFDAPLGRLKLRDFGDGRAELISYRRPDTAEARGSDFFVCPVTEPATLRAALAHALRTGGSVRKRRHLFLYRHTRIHLDDVEGLGEFVELETVMAGQSEGEAHAELRHVAAALALKLEDAIPQPYVELMTGRA
jgi:predicted adenylyl cyclase CyaB